MGSRSKSSPSKRNSRRKDKTNSEIQMNPPETNNQTSKPAEIEPINYQFVDKNVSVHLLCPSCKELFKNPMRLHPCGHTFCQSCLPALSCSQCQSKVKVVQKDLTGEGLVEGLLVKCLNKDCPFKDTLEVYKKYHKDSCKLSGGLDHWMKAMQSLANCKRGQKEEVGQQSTKKKKQDAESGGEGALVGVQAVPGLSIDWDDQTCKQIKRL